MSRNRMRNSQSLQLMGVLSGVLIIGMITGLGLCYMLCKNQNLHLAQKTQEMQKQLESIEARNRDLALDLDGMKSMAVLKRRLLAMHSTLVQWGDPHANWVRLDQNTRARLARIGTAPQTSLNLDASVMAANAAAQPGH